jgi:hypothetical protein
MGWLKGENNHGVLNNGVGFPNHQQMCRNWGEENAWNYRNFQPPPWDYMWLWWFFSAEKSDVGIFLVPILLQLYTLVKSIHWNFLSFPSGEFLLDIAMADAEVDLKWCLTTVDSNGICWIQWFRIIYIIGMTRLYIRKKMMIAGSLYWIYIYMYIYI